MPKYRFYTRCPACGGGPDQFKCKCGGKQYIDEDLYITCDSCDKNISVFNSRFKCRQHYEYKKKDIE